MKFILNFLVLVHGIDWNKECFLLNCYSLVIFYTFLQEQFSALPYVKHNLE